MKTKNASERGTSAELGIDQRDDSIGKPKRKGRNSGMRQLLRPTLLVFSIAFAMVVSETAQAEPDQSKRQPNILFALAGDWSWPHASIANAMGVPGSDSVVKTPVFDRIARAGVLFTNAYCSAPSCSPSRSAILTGRNVWELETAANLRGVLPAKFGIYPDALEAVGYHVGFIRKGWSPGVLGEQTRNPAGPRFESFEEFMEKRPDGKPFSFWFGSKDAHRGYERDSGIGSGMDPNAVAIPAGLPDDPIVRRDLCDYYYEVERFDTELGEMLDLLEQIGELANTIVVIAGDNGLPFPRCKVELYDTGTRVPLAIAWGDTVKGGRVVDDFVNLAELGPTFLEAAGLKPFDTMTVKSLMNILSSDEQGHLDLQRDKVFTGREYHDYECRADDTGYPQRAMRTADYLYIRNYEPDRWPAGDPVEFREKRGMFGEVDPSPTKAYMIDHRDDPEVKELYRLSFDKRPGEELYDLQKDPGQLTNVAALPEYAERKRELVTVFEREFGAAYDPAALGIPPRPADVSYSKSAKASAAKDPKSKDVSRSLGAKKPISKNKDNTKEVVDTMTTKPQSGTIEYYPEVPSKLRSPRPVEVWLPEGYDPASDDRYPVLYVHDGQFMLHHGRTPFTEKDYLWDLDTTMARLIEEGEIRPAIVVSVWADLDAKPNRQLEYMPEKPVTDEVWETIIAGDRPMAGGTIISDNYLKFLVHDLKPFIDKTYRTQPDRENTFVMGSSMGGMISAYAIAEYPDIFGGAACLSTHWPIGDGVVIDWYQDRWPEAGAHRIYFDHGTETYDAEYEPYQLKMDELMKNRGYRSGEDWITRRFEGADHSPRAWRERLHIPLVFLLGNR